MAVTPTSLHDLVNTPFNEGLAAYKAAKTEIGTVFMDVNTNKNIKKISASIATLGQIDHPDAKIAKVLLTDKLNKLQKKCEHDRFNIANLQKLQDYEKETQPDQIGHLDTSNAIKMIVDVKELLDSPFRSSKATQLLLIIHTRLVDYLDRPVKKQSPEANNNSKMEAIPAPAQPNATLKKGILPEEGKAFELFSRHDKAIACLSEPSVQDKWETFSLSLDYADQKLFDLPKLEGVLYTILEKEHQFQKIELPMLDLSCDYNKIDPVLLRMCFNRAKTYLYLKNLEKLIECYSFIDDGIKYDVRDESDKSAFINSIMISLEAFDKEMHNDDQGKFTSNKLYGKTWEVSTDEEKNQPSGDFGKEAFRGLNGVKVSMDTKSKAVLAVIKLYEQEFGIQ